MTCARMNSSTFCVCVFLCSCPHVCLCMSLCMSLCVSVSVFKILLEQAAKVSSLISTHIVIPSPGGIEYGPVYLTTKQDSGPFKTWFELLRINSELLHLATSLVCGMDVVLG